MAIFRRFLLGVLCAMLVLPGGATGDPINKVKIKSSSSGGAGSGNADPAISACAGKSKGTGCLEAYKKLDPHSTNMQAATDAKCDWITPKTNSPQVLSCFATQCGTLKNTQYYLVVKPDKKGVLSSTGNCKPQIKCAPGKKANPPFEWYDELDKKKKLVIDLQCKSVECDKPDVERNNAVFGKVQGDNCILQECKPNYYLNKRQNRCIPCNECKPTNANCQFISSNVKGDPKVENCTYDTSCMPNFENEQNHGKYNPICSLATNLPTMDCTQEELNAIGASGGEIGDDDKTCVATACKSATAIIVNGKCKECPPCNPQSETHVKCTVSVVNNECKYNTECESDKYENIQNNGTPDAICTKKKPEPQPEPKPEPETVQTPAPAPATLDIYKITYHLQPDESGCETLDRHTTYTAGQGIAGFSCEPKKEGYIFKGWCKNSLTSCDPEKFISIIKTDTGDIDFYPKFVEDNNSVQMGTFKITLEQNGGTGCDNMDYTFGQGTTINCTPVRDKFDFAGWCTDSELKTCTLQPIIAEDDDGDKTFYAKWTEKVRTECTEAEKATYPNATAFKFENGKCVPIKCEDGYKLQNGRCEEDKINQLQDKYDAAKENEQSLANRMLGGATIAATGIGGMELAMGLSQQKADKAADADMEAYISTFQCKVADNRYKGGESGIELTGANQLTKLYQEYADLAANLKERKAALGMKPGLESQVVLDKANMGLYDDVGHGIEKGTQASRYRASKGSETDAKKLQEEKDAAKKRVIAGGVVGGVGVVGGAIGNSAINGKLGDMIKGLKDNDNGWSGLGDISGFGGNLGSILGNYIQDSKNGQVTNRAAHNRVVNKLKAGLKSAKMKNVDALDFSNLDLSNAEEIVDKIDWSSISNEITLQNRDATQVFNTSNATSLIGSIESVSGLY